MQCRTCGKELTDDDLRTAVRYAPGDLQCLDCYCTSVDREYEHRLDTLRKAGEDDA